MSLMDKYLQRLNESASEEEVVEEASEISEEVDDIESAEEKEEVHEGMKETLDAWIKNKKKKAQPKEEKSKKEE